MEIPTNLKHKPVIVVEDYDKVDGRNALNTDAKGFHWALLSGMIVKSRYLRQGMATYWRKWSRQSEELPITRILDLAILAAQGSLYFQDAYRYENFMIQKIQS